MARKPTRNKRVRIVRLTHAPWRTGRALTYSTYGLDREGRAYRYVPGLDAWLPLSDRVCSFVEYEQHRTDRDEPDHDLDLWVGEVDK